MVLKSNLHYMEEYEILNQSKKKTKKNNHFEHCFAYQIGQYQRASFKIQKNMCYVDLIIITYQGLFKTKCYMICMV